MKNAVCFSRDCPLNGVSTLRPPTTFRECTFPTVIQATQKILYNLQTSLPFPSVLVCLLGNYQHKITRRGDESATQNAKNKISRNKVN